MPDPFDFLNQVAIPPRPWRLRVMDFSGRPATKETWYAAKAVFKDAFYDLVYRDAPPSEFIALAGAELAFREAFQRAMQRTGYTPLWLLEEPKWVLEESP